MELKLISNLVTFFVLHFVHWLICADSDTARLWRKYAHNDSEKCVEEK